MTDRYVVFCRTLMGYPTFHVGDTHDGAEIVGRWDTRETAQEHADHLNQEEQQ